MSNFCRTNRIRPQWEFRIRCFLIIILVSCQTQAQIGLILRYDDLSVRSPTDFEERLFAGIGNRGGRVLVGIIPPVGGVVVNRKWKMVRRFVDHGVIVPALHGYRHHPNILYPGPGKSEFSNLPLSQQKAMIHAGKTVLEKALIRPVGVFIPPYNSYDKNTLTALKTLGFDLVSASMGGVVEKGLQFLPGTLYPQDLPRLVSQVKARHIQRGLVVITMHPFDFVESNEPLPEFRIRHGGYALSLEDFFKKLDAALRILRWAPLDELLIQKELDDNRFQANVRLFQNPWVKRSLLPVKRFYPQPGIYYEKEDAEVMYWMQSVIGGIIYGFIGASAAVFGLFFSKVFSGFRSIFMYVFMIVGVMLLGYKIMRDGIYIRSAIALVIGAGWLLGHSAGLWTQRR